MLPLVKRPRENFGYTHLAYVTIYSSYVSCSLCYYVLMFILLVIIHLLHVISLSTALQKSYAAGTKRYLDSSLSPFPVFVSSSAQIAHGYAELFFPKSGGYTEWDKNGTDTSKASKAGHTVWAACLTGFFFLSYCLL